MMPSPREIGRTFVEAGREWIEDGAPRHAAALSYHAVFAIGPILLIATGVAGIILGTEAGEARVAQQVELVGGEEGARAVHTLADGAVREGGRTTALIGAVALLFTAGVVFRQLRVSLDKVWEVVPRKGEGLAEKVRFFFRKTLVGFLSVVVVGVLLLALVVAGVAMGVLAGTLPGPTIAWRALQVGVTLLVGGALLAFVYKVLPDVRIQWRDVLVGAAVTAVLFLIGQVALGFYFQHADLASRYGAAGAVMLVLSWTYYSALVFLYGAEFTQVWANRFGGLIVPDRHGRPLVEAVRERQQRPSQEGARRPAP